MSNPPPLEAAAPSPSLPPLPPLKKSGSLRATLAVLLSLYLGLFLADAIASLINDSLAAVFKVHFLGILCGPLAFLLTVTSGALYLLFGLTPMIPKRLFLPLALFIPGALLASIPLVIYFYSSSPLIAVALSLLQVGLGLAVLYRVQGGLRWRWPLVTADCLKDRRFSWRNLLGFLLINLLVLLPVVLVYLFFCASVAVDHFSDGFVALRPHGLTVQARKYVRDDGKTVQLFPMAHIAEPSFYKTLADSFTTNSIALMEGVSDEKKLLTNHISYKRMAQSLGMAEQQKEFKPTQGELVVADVDVSEFTPNTLGFLNLVMMVHAKGLQPEIVMQLVQFAPAPGFEQELLDDLLNKRNRHVVEELRSRLEDSEEFIVPWGAAHMPGIAKEIEKLGFRKGETQDFTVLRFRSAGKSTKPPQQTQ